MRKNNVKHALKAQVDTIKFTVKKNRKLILIGLGFVALGLIFALFGISDYVEEHPKASILTLICSGNFSVFSFEFKLIILVAVPVIICFLLSINYFLFLCNFIVICAFSFGFFRYVIACFCCGFLHGLITFLFVLLPIACLVFIGTIFFIASVCDLIRYTPCKKIFSITPYSVFIHTTKNLLLKYLFCVVLPSFVYANIVVIIMYLCCRA